MSFREIASFEVLHGDRAWPWVAFDARAKAVAFVASAGTSGGTVETRRLAGEEAIAGPSFAFSLSSDVEAPRLAVTGTSAGGAVVALLAPAMSAASESGARSVRLDVVLGEGHEVQALAFDRTGRRLWLSAEAKDETVIALLDVATLALVGVARSAAFPRPALHELHVHPTDDAVLLLAACGEDGAFARVVGFAGDEVSSVPGALDAGAIAAGFVGFSADGARVHLVEADELRTHAWPALLELSSVPLADDFVSSFSGAVLGQELLVDGEDADSRDDAVMLFDRPALHGVILSGPAPTGMWAGRLDTTAIVTIQPKGDPALARILLRTSSGAARILS